MPRIMHDHDDHIWFDEHLATYLAGGLGGEERGRFESHASTCERCAAELERARRDEAELNALFADASPAPGFEDRIIARLRTTSDRHRRLRLHPLMPRLAATAAAVLIVGGVGYVANETLRRGDGRDHASANFRQIGQAVLLYSNDAKAPAAPAPQAAGDLILRPKDASFGAFTSPSANSEGTEKWSFGGGSNTALNWSNWDKAAGVRRNLTYSYAAPVASQETERFKPQEFAFQSGGERESEILGRPVSRVEQLVRADGAQEEPPAAAGVGGAAVAVAGQAIQPVIPPETTQQTQQRKVIRNGQLEFEVDSFDSAVGTVTKVVAEEGGFIVTTDSQKLDNGKVRGTLVVRVPPDRLETLVLKLRALGDLKRQNLSAQDVTKQYRDLESELRAARAMEERLLEIIKSGKGEIKDLLAAEKELANWRGKIEKITGEMNYFDNLVALSTLSIELIEKNIATAAATVEQEEINAGVETSDVETARAEAIKSIDEAKGRIIEAELKQFDAGQLAAKIVAEVPQESAGAVVDRLKQLGKVSRLDVQRRQTTPSGAAPAAGARVETRPARLVISLYNLANVAPRETTNLSLAAADVEAAYRTLLANVTESGGRVVTSALNRDRPDQTSGSIQFEVPAPQAEAMVEHVRSIGDVQSLNLTENPDTANVTTAKRGFAVQLVSAAQVPPREAVQLGVETRDVGGAVEKLAGLATGAGGRVLESQHSRDADGRNSARLVLDVPLEGSDEVLAQVKSLGAVRAERAETNAQVPPGKLARARVEVTLASPAAIVSGEGGIWASVREGLSTSFAGLLWSLQILVVGLCFVVPWALVIWGTWKLLKRSRGRAAA